MPFLLLYIIKFSISLAVVFLFYHLVLRKLTFYNWNRLYLVGYTLLSFFVPFIDISVALQENKLSDHEMITWLPVIQLKGSRLTTDPGTGIWNSLTFLLIAGILIMAFRLCMQFISYKKMLHKATLLSKDGMNLYQVNDSIIPFSFGNSIFINTAQHTPEELQEIIRHEMVHVKQKHSIDILWSELFCILNWFNPFAWLIRKAIRQNLEFIADKNVLNNGIDRKQYQYLLLKVIGNNQFSIAQHFNFSSLKKRIAMMNKLKSAKINLLRFLFVLPLLSVILLAFRKQVKNKQVPQSDAITTVNNIIQDTIPLASTFSSQGYNLTIFTNSKKDSPLIIVSDKKNKEITRLTMDEWNNSKDYYDKLYRELPSPPPPPMPPAISEEKLSFVKAFKGEIEYIEVWSPNGILEKYNMSNKKEVASFEKKYWKIPIAPAPPAKAALIEMPVSVSERKVPATTSVREVPVVAPVVEERKVQSVNGAVTITEQPASIAISSQGNPLYVLDGTIINKAILDNVNPETIASVDVLKGNSAMALYGDKGSEGVIRITTKGASTTDKVIITANEVRQSVTEKNAITVKVGDIEMKNSKELVLLDGKELPADKRMLSGTFNVVTLTKDEATKKYGDKGKNGAIEMRTIN